MLYPGRHARTLGALVIGGPVGVFQKLGQHGEGEAGAQVVGGVQEPPRIHKRLEGLQLGCVRPAAELRPSGDQALGASGSLHTLVEADSGED